eukprot:CFRG4615T1
MDDPPDANATSLYIRTNVSKILRMSHPHAEQIRVISSRLLHLRGAEVRSRGNQIFTFTWGTHVFISACETGVSTMIIGRTMCAVPITTKDSPTESVCPN